MLFYDRVLVDTIVACVKFPSPFASLSNAYHAGDPTLVDATIALSIQSGLTFIQANSTPGTDNTDK